MTLSTPIRFARLLAPAGNDGADAGGTGTLDRGDQLEAPEPVVDDKPLANPFEDDVDDDDEEDGDKKVNSKPDEASPKVPKKGDRIPLARHKDILAKERAQREALEQRLAQYERGQQVAQTNEVLTQQEDRILKMEREYNALLADGEIARATELMSKIRQAERSISETRSEARAQALMVQARESARYDIVLERIEESYPVLNQDSDEYDEALASDVADLRAVYQGRGMPPSKALQEAVKRLVGQSTSSQRQATSVAPRVPAADIAAARKREAVARTLDATRRTPASTRDVGLDSDKLGRGALPDIKNMSQEAFAKLTDEDLARMRGDIL